MNILKNCLLKMKIRNWKEFKESISGWELVGQHMGPGYPEQELPVTLTQADTQILMGKDGEFYTYDDYQDLYQSYLKDGGSPLEGFTQENLDIILSSIKLESVKIKEKGKETILRAILNRGNLMLNKYDNIKCVGNILYIKLSYFDYGKGTKILPFLKHKSFFFDYIVDFKNKTITDKNIGGGTYTLNDTEMNEIENKYYWYKK